MNFKAVQKIFGFVLIVAGILGILQFMEILPGTTWDIVWAILFTVSSAAFFYVYFENRTHWWALIPGFSLLGIDLVIIYDFLVPGGPEIGGLLFLGCIGISFMAIFIMNREHWWAIIPGGTMITLGVVSIIEEFIHADISGSVFFAGLGLTFITLYLLPRKDVNLDWAMIPGMILIGLGALTSLSVETVSNMAFPIIIIAAGIIVLVKNLFNK